MALLSSSLSTSQQRGIVFTIPLLIILVSASSIFLFFLLSSVFSFSFCPPSQCAITKASPQSFVTSDERVSTTMSDIQWVKNQILINGLHMQDNILRKGIYPKTREQQLEALLQHTSFFTYYEDNESNKHTALPCPGELLVEQHHSNYGDPWASGRDAFEFLAESTRLTPEAHVLEIGCGTLRVGLHFIRYLKAEHFYCLERDELSLMAAFKYELPSQGLLHKRPIIVKDEDMDFSRFKPRVLYDLIYATAVFIHLPDKLVWVAVERLADNLKPFSGRLFVSHNIKFCSRLGEDECTKRLSSLGLEYVRNQTHDSLLFNHYELWFEFRRVNA